MLGVVEHVHERGADLPGGPQLPRVVAVGEHRALSSPDSVEHSCDADQQSLHAARERAPVVRLGDQVDVVRLQRVVGEAEAESLTG